MYVRLTLYHPQSNGQAEHFVDTFNCALLKECGEMTTEETLQAILLAYCSIQNESVKERKTPSEALMGQELRTTLDAIRPQKKQVRGQQPQKPLQIHTPVFDRNY